jgi:hypothetical protein
MEHIGRILALSRNAKVGLIFALAGIFIALSWFISRLFSDRADPEIIAAFTSIFASLGPAVLLSALVLIAERNEQIKLISEQSDIFLLKTVPAVIKGRYIGEPFDPKPLDEAMHLDVTTFHERESPHAGYTVSGGGKTFEFTVVMNVYRFTVFLPVRLPADDRLRREVAEHCDQLIATGFKDSYSVVDDAGAATGPLTMVVLRKDFDGAGRDLVFSKREQFFLSRELGEFCRTVIRAQLYAADFPVLERFVDHGGVRSTL